MEDGLGQDMVALSQTAWAVRKRPASPHNAGSQVFKRPWNSIPGAGDVNRPLQSLLPDQAYPPHLCNAASGWESGATRGDLPLGDVPLAYPVNDNGLTHLPPSSYESGHLAGMCFTGTNGQQRCLPGAGECRPSFLHAWPVAHLPQAGRSAEISPLQSPATDVAGPCLPLAPTVGGLPPPGLAPASEHGHTPSYTPSLPAPSGLETSYPLPDMHNPLARTASGPSSQPLVPYPEAIHARDQVPSHAEWSAPSYGGVWQPDPVSTEGSMNFTYNLCPSSTPTSEFVWTPQSAFFPDAVDDSYDVLYSTSDIRRYSDPAMESNNPEDGAFNNPGEHSSSGHQAALRRHGSWPEQNPLPLRGSAVHPPYDQQPSQHLSRYIEVVHSFDVQDNAQHRHTAFSDVEETVAADDDDELETKFEGVSGSVSAVDGPSPYGSQSQQSRNSSYVDLPSPGSVRQDDAAWQHALCPPRKKNSLGEAPSGGAVDCALVQQQQQNAAALPQTKSGRKRRGRFDNDARDETNRTRTMKACVACRKQKMRCRVDQDAPTAPCIDCRRRGGSSSAKVIHRWICIRTYTVSSIRITRPGGLGLTRRWEGTRMVDVADFAADGAAAPRTIHMLQGLSRQPIVVRVRKFRPRDGDVTYRQWEHNGVAKRLDLEPYCLADIAATADYFGKYLRDTAFQGLQEASHASCELVRDTFRMVGRRVERLRERARSGSGTQRIANELQFFEDVVTLVWSMRHTTGSVWLAGEEKLGMTVPDDEDYPLRNAWTGEKEVSLPRMIVAQFDSIQNERILPRQLKKVLADLESYLSSCKDEWFSMYLAVFMLLHEISVASRDRYRWARERLQKTRYGAGKYATLGMYVENFQKASHPLLAYWHYYKCDALEDVDWYALGKTKKVKHLEPDEAAFMRRTVELMREEAKSIPPAPEPSRWEHELYFVSHMFRRDWAVDYQTFNFMDE